MKTQIKQSVVFLLITSFLFPSLVSAFAYEPHEPLAQYPEKGIFLGVSAGLARKTGIAPIYFRVGFVLSALMGGVGLFAYIVLVVLMPTRHSTESPTIFIPPINPKPTGPDGEEPPPVKDEVAPEIYFQQVNDIMKEMKDAGNDLTTDVLKGKIASQAEYFRRLRNIIIESRDKFSNLAVPPKCKEIYQLFSEYFRYSLLSTDVAIEGLEGGDKEKIRQAEVESKAYDEKADELYKQAKSKILNWEK